MSKMGRPKIEIDWKKFQKYCEMFCTLEEISGLFDCSVDTIENKVKEKFECTFSDIYKKMSAKGKCSLRRLQWCSARNGNITMQIWLGKQYLGQTDKTEISGNDDKPIKMAYDPTKRLNPK
jgi:hypothetical protein